MSLTWRVVLINSAIVVAGAALLAVTPATVSRRVTLGEGIVLIVGVAVAITANVLLTRRAVAPLSRLTGLMEEVDLLRPGRRVGAHGGVREVVALERAFDAMLARLEHERHSSGRRAVAAQEDERARIGRELHDEVGQALTGVLLELQGAEDLHGAALRERVVAAREVAHQGSDAVREITRGLRPEALDDLGLRAAVVALASATAERARLRVRRRIAERLPTLDRAGELVVYRIAQESLTNVARHADAREVELELTATDGTLVLAVRDDGRGIPADAGGSGLEGMHERAVLAGGMLAIRRRPERGTEVELRLPVEGTA